MVISLLIDAGPVGRNILCDIRCSGNKGFNSQASMAPKRVAIAWIYYVHLDLIGVRSYCGTELWGHWSLGFTADVVFHLFNLIK